MTVHTMKVKVKVRFSISVKFRTINPLYVHYNQPTDHIAHSHITPTRNQMMCRHIFVCYFIYAWHCGFNCLPHDIQFYVVLKWLNSTFILDNIFRVTNVWEDCSTPTWFIVTLTSTPQSPMLCVHN